MSDGIEGQNSGPNQEGYLAFLERHEEIEDDLVEAQETVRSIRKRRKDLRKTISAEGYNLDAFDRALADGKRSGEEREAEDRAYRKMMFWQRKPVGYQVDMFDETVEGAAAIDVHRLKQIDLDGYAAGKEGHSATLNKWSPGTEEFARWLSAWTRGQSEKVGDEIKPPEQPKRGRGRPKGSGKGKKAGGATAQPDPSYEPAVPEEEAAEPALLH